MQCGNGVSGMQEVQASSGCSNLLSRSTDYLSPLRQRFAKEFESRIPEDETKDRSALPNGHGPTRKDALRTRRKAQREGA